VQTSVASSQTQQMNFAKDGFSLVFYTHFQEIIIMKAAQINHFSQ